MVSLDSTALELELGGVGMGWTDVSADVRVEDHVRGRRGIFGSGPQDRVARPGQLTFSLNNAATNSGSLVGYYSPDHANCRTGFDIGIRVRVRATYSGTPRTLFIGRLAQAVPTPGTKGTRKVLCTAYDWLEEAARYKLTDVATQLSKRSDECIQAILDAMPEAPVATSLATGKSTFEYALDTARDESSFALAEFQKITASEAGQLYLTAGGTLTFESRHTRPAIGSNQVTLDNSMTGLTVDRKRDLVLNRIQATVHPRRVDGSVVTLFTLRTKTLIRAGESADLFGGYVDPNQLASRVGGTDMVTPVATTDYTMNSAEDGSGTDLTASFTVTMSAGFSSGGNGFYATIANTGTTDGYVTFFRIRGKGIYDYENATLLAEDTSSQDTYGQNVLTLDLPYQNDPATGQLIADYNLSLYGSARTYCTAVTFWAHESSDHMLAALDRDISTRVGLVEDVTGITDVGPGSTDFGFFVNAVEWDLGPANRLQVTWTLAPADIFSYWLMGTAGASEIGVTTRLGY
jgi:hypothetical protein